MLKTQCTTTDLGRGQMSVYNFGDIKLHAYKTCDPIDDEVFVVERAGCGVVIEAPCFFDNINELSRYLSERSITIEGILIAYHGAGATFLPGARIYSTANADAYNHTGGGAGLVSNFAQAFGGTFDASVFTTTDFIEPGKITLAGIDFEITATQDAFDIAIPAIGTVYTHMLGHDCHSIVAGAGHADASIAQLKGYQAQGIDLILTSHYAPEDMKDAQTKIDYLVRLKEIALECADAASFKTAVQRTFPGYSGDNYLDMTAGFFFPAE